MSQLQRFQGGAVLLPVVFAALACVGGGCSSRSSDLADRIQRAAKLEGAKASSLPELAEAVQKIEDAGAGPTGLTTQPGPADSNAAAAFNRALSDADRLLVC